MACKVCPVCGWVWGEADQVCRGCLLLASVKGLKEIEDLKTLTAGWPRIVPGGPEEGRKMG